MKEIHILSRRDPKGDWCTRNRCGDINSSVRSLRMAQKEAEDKASAMVMGWIAAEPATEFKIAWIDV